MPTTSQQEISKALIVAGNNMKQKVEVIKTEDMFSSTHELADDLRKWFGAEKILRNPQTNEYLFVNLIPEAEIVTND